MRVADEDGVVEVARGFAVDGDDGKIAVVAAVAEFSCGGLRCSIACASSQHFGGKAMRQVKLADHDFDVDAEVIFVAEDFDDAAARVLGGATASR